MQNGGLFFLIEDNTGCKTLGSSLFSLRIILHVKH